MNNLRFTSRRFQNGSMNITLKNLPDPVWQVVREEAKHNGRSLNAQMIKILEAEAAGVIRRRQLIGLRKELDIFAASLSPLTDSAPLIRQGRGRS